MPRGGIRSVNMGTIRLIKDCHLMLVSGLINANWNTRDRHGGNASHAP